jgi:hypothetical protein
MGWEQVPRPLEFVDLIVFLNLFFRIVFLNLGAPGELNIIFPIDQYVHATFFFATKAMFAQKKRHAPCSVETNTCLRMFFPWIFYTE